MASGLPYIPELFKYKLLREVGQGGFGTVYLARNHTGDQVVIKRMELRGLAPSHKRAALAEAQLLRSMRHINIVAYRRSLEAADGGFYIVMDYCEGGDLWTVLRSIEEPLSETEIMFWFVQIVQALEYVHSKNILHRDLKTKNVFLTEDGVVKLGDFGVARVLDGGATSAHTLVGTMAYIAPEVLEEQPYNTKCDLWSLGCVLYEMMKLVYPAPREKPLCISRKPEFPKSGYSREIRHLCSALLSSDPECRPDVAHLLQLTAVRRTMHYLVEDTELKLREQFGEDEVEKILTETMARAQMNRKSKRTAAEESDESDDDADALGNFVGSNWHRLVVQLQITLERTKDTGISMESLRFSSESDEEEEKEEEEDDVDGESHDEGTVKSPARKHVRERESEKPVRQERAQRKSTKKKERTIDDSEEEEEEEEEPKPQLKPKKRSSRRTSERDGDSAKKADDETVSTSSSKLSASGRRRRALPPLQIDSEDSETPPRPKEEKPAEKPRERPIPAPRRGIKSRQSSSSFASTTSPPTTSPPTASPPKSPSHVDQFYHVDTDNVFPFNSDQSAKPPTQQPSKRSKKKSGDSARRIVDPAKERVSLERTDSGRERSKAAIKKRASSQALLKTCQYVFSVQTSRKLGSSTDASVFVQLYGPRGCTNFAWLTEDSRDRRRCFRRGATDKFTFELPDVGDPVEKLRVGHDDSGLGAGWRLSSITLEKQAKQGTTAYTFPCKRWLARDEDDHDVVRELVPSVVSEKQTQPDGSVTTSTTQREPAQSYRKYRVEVYTGAEGGAGIDANIFVTLWGTAGDSGERRLYKSQTHYTKFQKKQRDIFVLEAVALGELERLDIRHDDTSPQASWKLDRVVVTERGSDNTFEFPCGKWFSSGKDDGKILRTLLVKQD